MKQQSVIFSSFCVYFNHLLNSDRFYYHSVVVVSEYDVGNAVLSSTFG